MNVFYDKKYLNKLHGHAGLLLPSSFLESLVGHLGARPKKRTVIRAAINT